MQLDWFKLNFTDCADVMVMMIARFIPLGELDDDDDDVGDGDDECW